MASSTWSKTGWNCGGSDAFVAAIAAGSKSACGLADPLPKAARACGGKLRELVASAILMGSSCDSTAPRIATPTVLPIFRQNWIWLETTPRYLRSTALWVAFR